MAKVLGTVLRLMFWLLILGALGYNTWQVNVLHREVAALQRERAGTAENDASARSETPSGRGSTPLALARRHMEQAQAFLRKKQYADAQREMRAATEALGQASRQVGAGSAGALTELRRTLKSLSEQAEALWQRQEGKESELRK